MIPHFVKTSDGYWNVATITRIRKINRVTDPGLVDGMVAEITVAGHGSVGLFENEYVELVKQIERLIDDGREPAHLHVANLSDAMIRQPWPKNPHRSESEDDAVLPATWLENKLRSEIDHV